MKEANIPPPIDLQPGQQQAGATGIRELLALLGAAYSRGSKRHQLYSLFHKHDSTRTGTLTKEQFQRALRDAAINVQMKVRERGRDLEGGEGGVCKQILKLTAWLDRQHSAVRFFRAQHLWDC